MDAYVLGTSTTVDFKLPEDEFHSQWGAEGRLRPNLARKG